MDLDIPKFDDKTQENNFLRNYIGQLLEEKCLLIQERNQVQQELDDTKQDLRRVEHDFQEFQENSQLLEKELETSLEQTEKSNREIRVQYNRLQMEYEKLRDRSEQNQRLCDMKDSEITKLRDGNRDLQLRTRELEQRNDDLERALRAVSVSKGETESKLNAAIERDALLECEHEELLAMVQRLKDEKRDLAQELKIRDKDDPEFPDNDKCLSSVHGSVDSNKLMVEMETQTTVSGSPMKYSQCAESQNIPLTPSNRISGMNIVSDLLRNIGSVESKLACGRNAAREASHSGDHQNREPYRGRRVVRGTNTSPTIHGFIRA
ncbi:Uncharacterized protein GBIM_15607 [Gryllus bimaculatus]|nr:Uncharacterized protein GBIM_15607 [Gryllus bimaculatus]